MILARKLTNFLDNIERHILSKMSFPYCKLIIFLMDLCRRLRSSTNWYDFSKERDLVALTVILDKKIFLSKSEVAKEYGPKVSLSYRVLG